MFKTHDNKLSEHELSIGDCLEHLKEIDERLAAVECSSNNNVDVGYGEVVGGDLSELMNDSAFINGIVDNIMTTTNFASIVENVIPLKEENEALKQQIQMLNERMHDLETRLFSISSGGGGSITLPPASSEECAAVEEKEDMPIGNEDDGDHEDHEDQDDHEDEEVQHDDD